MTVWTRPEAVAYGADLAFESLVGEKLRELGWTCEVLRASDPVSYTHLTLPTNREV